MIQLVSSNRIALALMLLGLFGNAVLAHPLGPNNSAIGESSILTNSISSQAMIQAAVAMSPAKANATGPAASFNAFAPLVRTRTDSAYLYVESNGMPEHPMMIGITAWQQQVPLPQPYTGDNAWRIPLNPVPAKEPMSAKEDFFRGAIALAANGVPIFNPIKNDGRADPFLAGELDEYGGHSGRVDDYHYHISPLHLQTVLGEGRTKPLNGLERNSSFISRTIRETRPTPLSC